MEQKKSHRDWQNKVLDNFAHTRIDACFQLIKKIEDGLKELKTMKLYELPRNSHFVLQEDASPPPAGLKATKGERLKFKHMDGMYGWCINQFGDDVYVPAWTVVSALEEST